MLAQQVGLVIQPIFEHHGLEIGAIEQLDIDVRVKLAQLAQLAVLFGDEFLLHRGQFNIQILPR